MLKIHHKRPSIRSAIIDYIKLQGLQDIGEKLVEIGIDK